VAATVEHEPFALEILSPEATVFSGRCESMLVRTAAGEIEILPRHEPLLAVLVPGPVVVRQPLGTNETACVVTGGFLHVTDSMVTLLADGFQSGPTGGTS
jgi:F-type H+-transporting ATPase subunit epsilon